MDDLEPRTVMQDELRVVATIENVRRVVDFVRDAGRRIRLTQDVLFDIDVAVEEACANIVRHAYGSAREGDIQVRVEATEDAVCITLTDWGLPFDADASHLDTDAPVEARAEGGMGVLLVHELMDDVTRQTASVPGGPNVLTLIKNVRANARPAAGGG